MYFEFATASRIIFGPGTIKEAVPAAKSFGKNAFIVLGESNRKILTELMKKLKNEGLTINEFLMSGEPTVASVASGLEQARAAHCDVVIGIGGGSVLDTGKAIAGLVSDSGEIYDYLELVGRGKPLPHSSVPYIAIPTTAGTGSEVTRNAVLADPEARVKVSLRGPTLLPRLAIVDPELTYSLPSQITAASGMDALTQLIEPFVSNAPNLMIDGICREGMCRVSRSLLRAFQHGEDLSAREDMSLASLFSGIALANSKLGAVHGLAGPIGGMFPAHHGAVCARLLPVVMEQNWKALSHQSPQNPVLARFDEVGRLLTGDQNAGAEQGIKWLRELSDALNILPLGTYGIDKAALQEIVMRSKRASSMKGNPIELTDLELMEVMQQAL